MGQQSEALEPDPEDTAYQGIVALRRLPLEGWVLEFQEVPPEPEPEPDPEDTAYQGIVALRRLPLEGWVLEFQELEPGLEVQ